MTGGLISVIGPPAVGKTMLAEYLAAEMPAGLLREDYAGNPFLADSYAGRDEMMLPSQLYFLMSRVAQLSLSTWPADGLFVSDYGFCQDRIFAAARLARDDLGLYDRLACRFERLLKSPDVLVHLDAAEDTLLERIAARGREFEKAMTRQFLSAMRRAYNGVGAEAACPVVRIDCEAVDLRADRQRAAVISKIREML